MSNLKYRLLIIAALVLGAVWTLIPRTVYERTLDTATGVWTVDTVRRVPLKYGLDLAGGVHLALEIDESRGAVANREEALDRALTVVRNRIDEFGTTEPLIQRSGEDRIVVELPGVDDPERAQQVVQRQAFLEFQIVDESQALERVLPRLDQIVRDRGLATAVADSAAGQGAPGGGGLSSLLQSADSGRDSARGDTAAVPDALGGPFSRLVQRGEMIGEYLVATRDVPAISRYLADEFVRAALPPGKVIRWAADSIILGTEAYRGFYVLDSRPIITGESIVEARPMSDPTQGILVLFELNNEGASRFRRETRAHVQDYMAIVLDQRVMGRPPIIQSEIGRNGQITMGGQDLQAATDLALVLRAGSLPVPLRVVEATKIGASLGQDAIDAGIRAGIIAVALVILIMVVYYRFSGFLAVIGLMFYTLTTLAVLAQFGATLTLPGIAGFVLSIGMAVDANFLQFERIREELDRGKTVRTAVDEGFKNSFSAIIDTHVTTELTGAVLYQYGTGPVQGFAVTLVAGVVSSMVSSVFVVRTLFLWWLSGSRGSKPLSI